MTITRFVWQAGEKVDAICAMLHRHKRLPKADIKSLAGELDIPYTTLTSAINKGRFSIEVEERLSTAGRFDRQDRSSVVRVLFSECTRRERTYAGVDSAERFRAHLAESWAGASVDFRTERSEFKAFDPHMVKHQLSDAGQATPAGMAMQLFLAAHFQPFHHRSGIAFGFRKAALMVEIHSGNARASECLGYPTAAVLGDASIRGEARSPLQRWVIEGELLAGEYATRDQPLMSLAGCEDGISLTSSIDVNIFDRTSFVSGRIGPIGQQTGTHRANIPAGPTDGASYGPDGSRSAVRKS